MAMAAAYFAPEKPLTKRVPDTFLRDQARV
jgi:hypothetical protein